MTKIKKIDIIDEATEIKTFIEKNKKLPRYCTITGNQYSVYTTAYLISRTIANLKAESFNLQTITKSNQGFSVKLNENCSKITYLDMISRFNEYCEKNKRIPAYVVTIKNKADFTTYLYGVCKILNYYKENKVLPNSCLFTSKYIDVNKKEATKTKNNQKPSTSSNANLNIYTSSPHYLNTGCNNLGQCTSYYCAPHSIHQSIRKFGITKHNEKQLAKWCGTTTYGTDHSGINTCIAKISKETGVKLSVEWRNFSDLGNSTDARFLALGKLICKPNKAVLCHIGYQGAGQTASGTIFGHYECLDKINTKTKYVRALNSLGSKKADGSYNGHLQDRTYNLQATYFRNTPGGQKAICIITKE